MPEGEPPGRFQTKVTLGTARDSQARIADSPMSLADLLSNGDLLMTGLSAIWQFNGYKT